MASNRGRGGRPRKSSGRHDVRLFYRRGWVAADLRPFGLGRPTLRDPEHAHWPRGGPRTDSLIVARTWVGAYLEQVHRLGRRPANAVPRKLKAAFQEFERHRATTVETNTQGTDRTVRGHLLAHFGDIAVTDAAAALQGFFDYLGRRGHVPSTIGAYSHSVFAFLEWAGVPWPRVKLPEIPESQARFWSDAEIVRLREGADYVGPQARLALELLLGTGARQQELFALSWSALSERDRSVRITEQLEKDYARRKPLKGKRARTALVLPSWWSFVDGAVSDWRSRVGLVLAYPDGRAIRGRQQRKIIDRVLDAARLKETGVGFHAGRHTYGRLCLEAGCSLEQLRVFLGHRSITTTDQIYGHLTEAAALRLGREAVFGTG